MSAQLVSIEGRTRSAEVNSDVVRILKEWLERAESGDLVQVSICGVNADHSTRSESSMCDCFQLALAAVTVLQHRMLEEQRSGVAE